MRCTQRNPLSGTDSSSLEDLFERDVIPLIPSLYSYAMQLTRHRPDAEDLLQETLLKAFAGFHRFQKGTNVRAWLYRIETNSYITQWRRQQLQPLISLNDESMAEQVSVNAGPWSKHVGPAEDQALEHIPDTDIASAMRALPESFRTVVYYADVEGRTARQIAELTKTPVGTVMSRLHRGRRRLRGLMSTVPTSAMLPLQSPATPSCSGEKLRSVLADNAG